MVLDWTLQSHVGVVRMLQCTTFSGAVVTLLLSAASLARGLDNGLALRPPLGWSTWQTCGNAACSHDACTEDEIKSVATAMMNNGMQVRGYNHGAISVLHTVPCTAWAVV